MGDINPSVPFYSPRICLGINYRENLNPRYVVKLSADYLKLSASDIDFNNPFQQSRGASFISTLYDIATQFEFNFLPFNFVARKIKFSPFVSSGIGVAYILGAAYSRSVNLVFPAALGVKCSLGKKISVGLEWNMRKLFNDKLDGVQNISEENLRTIFHNTDWYFYTGLFFTYKVFDWGGTCPAYPSSKY
jgi:hypothetical protein